MTNEERVQAIADYGFTNRQARFLVLVIRHAGLCIKRQYGEFARVPRGGEKCNMFFEKLVRRGFAAVALSAQPRTALSHPLQAAVSLDRGAGQSLPPCGARPPGHAAADAR